MATITGTFPAQGMRCGPFKIGNGANGDRWFMLLRDVADNTLVSVWWSDTPLTLSSYTEVSTNQPDFVAEILSMSGYQVDSKLYIVAANADDDVYFARLDMTGTPAWDVVTGAVHEVILLTNNAGTTTFNACDLTVESDGSTMHVFYQADTVKVMGAEQERIHHLRSDNADSASVTVASTGNLVFGISAGDEFDWSGPRCVMGASDRTHVLGLSHETAGALEIWHNDVTTGGTPTATNDDDTTFLAESTEAYMLGTPCSFNRAGTVKCRFPYVENTTNDFEMVAFDSGAAPTFTSQNVTATNPAQGTGGAPACTAVPLGSTVYGVWTNGSDSDIDYNNDTDSDTWGADQPGITTTAGGANINIYDNAGPQVACLFTLAGTITYAEIAITVSTASLNDVDMGEFHSHHGPFEI